MACSSIQRSSSAQMTRRYDVFVSFRGKDTRYNFTDHLFGALQRKGIVTFRDDTKLKKGESIAPELLRAIEGSQIYIVVFSKNYASSTWCLRELEKILDCVQVSEKRVLPIFYDVDPSEVRYLKGSFAETFEKHEERFKQDSEMVRKWRAALTQVANLSGWDVRHKPQYAEIEKIVEEIINILGHKFSSLPNDLVGIHTPVEELEKLLHLDLVDDVRVVGISGMGGIGKTTLATVLYSRISHQFGACCFIDDVSKIYIHDGPIGAQKQILHQTLGEEHLQICNNYKAANLIQRRLRGVRALIILDNVDRVEQLEKLAMNREWLGAGSRIIIVSRDEHILKEYGVDVVYKVPLLNWTNSFQLFCRKAFKRDNIMSNYEELAHGIVYYANGLPLAIKVLGSFFYGRDISEWRSALARLRDSPNKDIMDVLRLSFDGLEEMEKEIFLDIACFFCCHSEEYVKSILNCCGFHADIGLRVLIDKSLISISIHVGIVMHDLLRELGRKIVQENSTKEPRRWSRLWLREHVYNIMLENMEKNVEAIVLNHKRKIHSGEALNHGHQSEIEILMAEALSKMSHLRLLIIKKVNCSGSLSYLSNKLRYVEWREYPFMYLPANFQPSQLVKLFLKHSNIKQLWKGKKYLPRLRTLDLSHSKNLIKMPNFGEVPNLELLNLEGCVKLVQMDPSIGVLRKLVSLNLKDCKNLISIPNNIFGLNTLEDLNLSGCFKVFNNPRHLKKLDKSESALHSQSTSSIMNWIKLPFHSLYPRAHKDLASCLLPSLLSFSSLCDLDISFCGLRQIPVAIGCLRGLERLNLGGNNFVTLPSLMELSTLVCLNLEHCKQLKYLPKLPSPPAVEQDHHMSSKTRELRAGLYFFNCPELDEGERCSSLAFSWMIQFIQANQESSVFFFDIDIVVPGSEIPSWFNKYRGGYYRNIDPYPIMHDNNFIGLACCAVFSVPLDGPTTTRNEWQPVKMAVHFKSCNTGAHLYSDNPIILDRDLITVKSNHMWLIYFSRKSFFHMLRQMGEPHEYHDDLKFIIEAVGRDKQGLEVKNCGHRWLFKEDLQLLNLTMMQSENSLAWKHKILAIEDEGHSQNHNHSSD